MSAQQPNPLASLPARIAAKIDLDGPGECWLWIGCRNHAGYGQLAYARRRHPAHRVVYTLLVGPIPKGLTLDHVKARGCTSRACVNPAHLEPVTQRENLLRGATVTARHAATTHCPQGHPYDAENTRVTAGKRVCRACHRARERQRWRDGKKGRATTSRSQDPR